MIRMDYDDYYSRKLISLKERIPKENHERELWSEKTLEPWNNSTGYEEGNFENSSGIKSDYYYNSEDIPKDTESSDLGRPGEFPFTRGIYPNMYRGRLWTMRMFSGFGTP